jgi:hypothetical protein
MDQVVSRCESFSRSGEGLEAVVKSFMSGSQRLFFDCIRRKMVLASGLFLLGIRATARDL